MNGPRFLNKIEDANVNKARTLRQRIESDVDHSQVDKKQPFSLQTFAVFQSRLINFNDYPVDFRNYFEDSFLDVALLRKLERSKVINWYRTAKLLYPLKTTGDINCLFHAVSLAIWAIEDTQQFLRRLVYLTLSTDPAGAFKRRWLFNRRPIQDGEANLRQNTCDSLVEWESIVKAVADIQQQQEDMMPFEIFESFHLYVLANILRRPIIVLADKNARNIFGQSLQESNIGGIYLPLETVPAECVKTPVIIGYNMNHFAPLVTQDGDSSSRMDVVPLVTHELEMMVVHYLLPGEEPDVVRLLENYLQMTETLLTETDYIKPILLVHLEERKLPEDLNLMEDLRQDCENKFREWIDQEFGSENSVVLTQENLVVTPKQNIVVSQRMPELQDNNRGPSLCMIMTPVPLRQTPLHPQVNQLVSNQSNRQKCLTTGCMMYGSPEMYNLCSKCFNPAHENIPGQFVVSAMIPPSRSLTNQPTRHNNATMTDLCSNSSNDSYAERKYICATPGCQGIRLKNTLDLCYKCLIRATPKKESRSDLDTEENAKHNLNHSAFVCSTEIFMEYEEKKRLDSTLTEKMVSCAGITCGKLIYPPKKLCDECQEILECAYTSISKQDFRQNVTAPILSNPVPLQLRPHTAPVDAKTNIPTCDCYSGGPDTGNMCTAHFPYTQRTITTTCQTNAPLADRQHVPSDDQQDIHPVNQNMSNSNPQDTYSANVSADVQTFPLKSVSMEDSKTDMTDIDQSRRSNSKCIIQECLNFGNPLNQGICNTCAMTHIDLSRRSNSKCCIQECLNIGNPLNQGICNTCDMTHFDLSRRSNSKCCIQECLNIGNPLNQGICNTCAMTHFDLSRRSNSKCIIQECLNIGNPLNQGICNTCAMTHIDLSRRSNSKCIIEECINFGIIQNQGMCNDCLRAYLAEK